MIPWKNIKVGRKLFIAFGAGVVTNVVVAACMFWALGTLKQTAFWTEHTYRVLGELDKIIAGMVNQETGLRGYLVGGTESFLEPYRGGTSQTDRAVDQVASLTADNPTQQSRIADARRLIADWRERHAEPTIKLMHEAATVEAARQREASGAGKAGMDAIRAVIKAMRDAESSLLDVRANAAEQAQTFALTVLLVGGAIGAAIAIFMARAFARSVVDPMVAITSVMDRITRGETEATIDMAARGDEVGSRATAARTFAETARTAAAEAAVKSAREASERERMQREAAEKAREAKEDQLAINEIGRGLKALAEGDLTHRILPEFAAKTRSLKEDFNAAIAQLSQTIMVVTDNTRTIRSGTEEIATAAADLSSRTERHAAALEETAAALGTVTSTVKKSAEGARHASEVVASADRDAKTGSEVVRQAIQAMDGISASSQQIGQIIGVIDEIAFQTNLLALNAGVEAARAGEAGRGFAVVASEVRALAQRSAEAAKEIKELISNSAAHVETGVRLVASSGSVLERISSQVSEINSAVAEIAAGTQEQAMSLEQINSAITQMDQVTQQNATMVEESSAASRSLSQETSELVNLVGQFRVGESSGGASRRELRQSAPQALEKASPFALPKKSAPQANAKPVVRSAAPRLKSAGGAAISANEVGWDEF